MSSGRTHRKGIQLGPAIQTRSVSRHFTRPAWAGETLSKRPTSSMISAGSSLALRLRDHQQIRAKAIVPSELTGKTIHWLIPPASAAAIAIHAQAIEIAPLITASRASPDRLG